MIPSKFLLISVAGQNPEISYLVFNGQSVFLSIRIVMFKAYNLVSALLKVLWGADNIW